MREHNAKTMTRRGIDMLTRSTHIVTEYEDGGVVMKLNWGKKCKIFSATEIEALWSSKNPPLTAPVYIFHFGSKQLGTTRHHRIDTYK